LAQGYAGHFLRIVPKKMGVCLMAHIGRAGCFRGFEIQRWYQYDMWLKTQILFRFSQGYQHDAVHSIFQQAFARYAAS
jgi:hypothetical protein